MIPDRVLTATSRRFDERAQHRYQVLEKLKVDRFGADTPERVQKRLARLSAYAAVAGLSGAATPDALPPSVVSFSPLERVLGTNDLMSVTFLERAVRAGRCVGRVRIRGANGQLIGYGTGSLVSPQLLLTNNHVLGSLAEAGASQIELNFQDGIDGGSATPVLFNLRAADFFITDPELDYTLVAVAPTSVDSTHALTEFGFNRIIESEGKAIIGEFLNIIQHPNGEPKQVALRENQLIDVLDLFLHYHTDTAPGSSGSPVFNDQWELVALHHSGVPKRNAAGRILTVDDQLWTPSMGEQRIQWVANEGARISRIAAHLKARPLTSTARAMRDQVFSETVRADASPILRGKAGRATISDDGTISWSLPIPPLQISLKMGDLVGGGSSMGASAPVPSPARPVADEPAELRDALAELERARRKPYYSKTKDEQARDTYYGGVDLTLAPDALFTALKKLVITSHTSQLTYKPSTHVYPWVDLHENLEIRSIYSGKSFDPEELIREDFRIAQERALRLQETLQAESSPTAERLQELSDWLEANLPFNCEHVVPQSWFGKAEPMRGDLHHLFACEVGCNSFRGNKAYFDFADFEEAIRDECGKTEGQTKFEPTASKGIVARATLYFLLRYPGQVNDVMPTYDLNRLRTLLTWHREHPVTLYERHRNAAIFEKQGNRNPLIDFPDMGDRVRFESGL
jgi:endonuclease I/V8-like Glu-specific endopeptidase